MRILTLALPLLFLGLAGCTETETGGPLVENACTEHPKYGTGNPHVTIKTNLGSITAEIFVDKVPNTGMNFVKLAEDGTFDGSPFHRIITNFMMQGGDHTMGNGRGGEAHPDCADAQGNIADEFHADLKHDRKGVLSMANAGPNTGSSQFFITFAATSWLDGKHAIFGQVVEGMDVVDEVNRQAGSQSGAPRTPVNFESASVHWP